MSAKDRAQKAAEQRDRRFVMEAMEGLRQCLDSPSGRAYFWFWYSENIDAEGKGGKGRRAVAREQMKAARIANWEGVQIMREEWEKPKLGTRAEAEEPEGEE